MFLSHVFAIVCGLAVVPMLMLTAGDSVLVKIAGSASGAFLLWAAIRLGGIHWVWIGPTGEQITRSIEDIRVRMAAYDKELFDPDATPETLPPARRAEIIKARKRLFALEAKRKALLSRYTVPAARR